MKPALVLLLATALLHAACKRQPTSGSETPAAPEAPASSSSPAAGMTANPAAPASVPAASTAIPQSKPGASESSPLNSELTDAVARFRDKHKRLPSGWQELVQAGFLKALPQPPPGIRYAIDPISAMVVELKAK